MANVVNPPNARMARVFASQGERAGMRPPHAAIPRATGGGTGGGIKGGTGAQANPLSAGMTPQDVQAAGEGGIGRPYSMLGLLTGETARQNALIHSSQAAQVMNQQHVRDALATLAQSYAQTGNKAQALSAMIRQNPNAFGDMFAAGMLKNPKDIDSLLTMGATGAAPQMRDLGHGMTEIINTDRYGNQRAALHNNPLSPQDAGARAQAIQAGKNAANGPQPPRGTKLVKVQNADGSVGYAWAAPGQPLQPINGANAPAAAGKQPKALDQTSMGILRAGPELYGALRDIDALHFGGAAGTGTLTALGAKYGVASNAEQILQAAKARIEGALTGGALGTKYAGLVRDWMKNVSPQNVWSESYNHVLAQALMRETQRMVQSQTSMAEGNIGRPLPAETVQQLDNMGVRTQSKSLLGVLRSHPETLTPDEMKILAGGNYDLTPQDVGALRAQAMKLQSAAPGDGQEAAAGKGAMPSGQPPVPPAQPSQDQMPPAMQQQQQANDQVAGIAPVVQGAAPPAQQTQPAQPPQPPGRPVNLPPPTGQSLDQSQGNNLVPGGALQQLPEEEQ